MRRNILRGTSLTTVAQLVPLIINIVLTPHIIGAFGIPRYGLFLLANTILAFLGSFDGGIGTSVARWSAVYAGTDDRVATTRLVTTMLGLVSVIGVVLFILLFALANGILGLFSVPPGLRAEGVFLLQTMAVILGLSQIRGLFAAQLSARQQYGWQSMSSVLSYVAYAVGLVLTIQTGAGLRGVAFTFIAQTAVATLLIIPRGAAFLTVRGIGIMPPAEINRFLRYALQVQAIGLSTIVNSQADTFIVGKVLNIGAVAIYGAGANFAGQLRAVPANALMPMTMSLATAYGEGGREHAIAIFTPLQRTWVQASTGWCVVALGAAYFGISSWLGPRFELSGVVACLMMAAHAVTLWACALAVLLGAVQRPEVETRYVVTSVLLNLALTVPGVVLFGVIGTVLATCLASVASSLYLIRIVRRRFDPNIRSFLLEVPVRPSIAALATVVGLELLLHPFVPQGALGLLLCGIAAAPGLAVFTVCLLGPRAAFDLVRTRIGRVAV